MNQPEKKERGEKLNASRRRFLKLGLAGAGVAAAAAGSLLSDQAMFLSSIMKHAICGRF